MLFSPPARRRSDVGGVWVCAESRRSARRRVRPVGALLCVLREKYVSRERVSITFKKKEIDRLVVARQVCCKKGCFGAVLPLTGAKLHLTTKSASSIFEPNPVPFHIDI